MKQLIIIGAGGFGREVLVWAQAANAQSPQWNFKGFLDDNPHPFPTASEDLNVIGSIWDYTPLEDDCFICAIGNPRLRKQVWLHFTSLGASFTRIIHPTSIVGPRVQFGEGCIISPGNTFTCDITVGVNCAFNIGVSVGHDAVIGDHCQINSHADITGYVNIGSEVMTGSRISVIPNKKVGDRAILGAGSVVFQDVPENTTVFGNPAKILTKR